MDDEGLKEFTQIIQKWLAKQEDEKIEIVIMKGQEELTRRIVRRGQKYVQGF